MPRQRLLPQLAARTTESRGDSCSCSADPEQFVAMVAEYDRARRAAGHLNWTTPLPITNALQWTCAAGSLHPVVLDIVSGSIPADPAVGEAVSFDLDRPNRAHSDGEFSHDDTPHGRVTLLANGKVFTGNDSQPWAEAVAICGERIIAVGTTADLSAAYEDALIVDIQRRVVIPGINDAHMHHTPDPVGVRLPTDELMDPSLPQLDDAVIEAVKATPPGTWLFGTMGMDLITDESLTRRHLDSIAPAHPVILLGMTNHTNVLNSAALASLGIADTDEEVLGGTLERDPGTGLLNGRINEYSQWRPQRTFAAMTSVADGAASIQALSADCMRFGITTIQNMSWTAPELYLEMVRAAQVPVRVRMIDFPAAGTDRRHSVAATAERAEAAQDVGSNVTWSGRKWILDGTPVEFQANNGVPYLGRDSTGTQNFPSAEIDLMLAESLADNDQLLLHAIGTQAVHLVADALARDESGTDWGARHLRVEHADGVAPADLASLTTHGAMIVQNPMHFMLIEMYSLRFGDDHGYSPFKSLFSSGIPVGIGSDGPLNPFLGIFAAVIHPTNPAEGVDVATALSAYTAGSARAEGRESDKGRIAPGYLADLAVLSQDIFSIDPTLLPSTESLLTIVGGVIARNVLPD